MADSFTPNLNLRKPEVGSAYDTWGGVAGVNSDMDLLDAVFLATGLGTSVGIHVGTGKVLNVEGQLQVADSTDTTKRATFSAALVPTATTVNLAIPAIGGTIATVDVVSRSHPVGTVLSGYYGVAPIGFVMVDGRTIGDVTSGATNRANDDCQRLFLHLWGLGFAVVGGRGATAAADWAAHRQLTLPNHSSRGMAGRDNLSGTAAGVWPGWSTLAQVGGAITSATGNINSVGVNNINFGNLFINFQNGGGRINSAPSSMGNGTGPAQNFATNGDEIILTYFAGYTNVNGNFNIGVNGASAAFNIVQPTIAVDVVMAL